MYQNEGYITTDDGVQLFYQEFGHGTKTVIVLNGYYLVDDFKYLADDHTVIFLDLRNRGRSEYITDDSKLQRGVLQDVDDLETARRQFGIDHIALFAHSYAGIIVILYAMRYADRVNRIVQIGPIQRDQSTQFPAELSNADKTLHEFFSKAKALQEDRSSLDSKEFCRRFWALLRVIYVADPADADKIRWEYCDLPTELNGMKYWMGSIIPSIQKLKITPEELSNVQSPTLIVHGTKDRSSPYGGGREWAMMLPNARLLTVENCAHAPWIEFPEIVLPSIRTFLNGNWPEQAQKVRSLI